MSDAFDDYRNLIEDRDQLRAHNEQLRADLSESRRLLDEARAQKPTAWLVWCQRRLPLATTTHDARMAEHYRSNGYSVSDLFSEAKPSAPVPAQPAKFTAPGPITGVWIDEQPAAVPEAVAKDVSDSALLKAYTTETGKVLPHSWRPIFLDYARIGIKSAILSAADTEVKNG